jgi:Tfp pilus assembly protein FimT
MVVAILGVVAAAAIPGLRSGDGKRLDLAAEQVAQAIRYARSEALRSGQMHGIEISQNTQRVVVYRADLSTDPVGMAAILTHPVDKKPYDFDLNTAALVSGVRITNALDPFKYATGRRMNLLFSATGAPVWTVISSHTTYPLQDGMVQLDYGNQRRTVRVTPYTGRVTIQ